MDCDAPAEVVLEWKRFSKLTEARSVFNTTPCIYAQTTL
jgi:hypothetical protein